MTDEDERYRLPRPMTRTRGFESLNSESNDQAREVLREERLEPHGGEDSARDGLISDLTQQEPRPLTDDEREATEHDPERPERVYAPASARVPKEPAPGDDRLIRGD